MDDVDAAQETNEMDQNQSEWNRIQTARKLDGYRDGVVAGQEHVLQQSFNNGFVSSFNRLAIISRLRGILIALYGYLIRREEMTDARLTRLRMLLDQIEMIERQWSGRSETSDDLLTRLLSRSLHISSSSHSNDRIPTNESITGSITSSITSSFPTCTDNTMCDSSVDRSECIRNNLLSNAIKQLLHEEVHVTMSSEDAEAYNCIVRNIESLFAV